MVASFTSRSPFTLWKILVFMLIELIWLLRTSGEALVNEVMTP
jgi:hypothetical protein